MGNVLADRLRHMALRQGLRLEKSRSRDPQSVNYGTYRLVVELDPSGPLERGHVVLDAAGLYEVDAFLHQTPSWARRNYP
jgi:hypothetical protein